MALPLTLLFMSGDKYTATWVSHTSINDFLQCPRAYFLKHVYRDPKNNHKIKMMGPPLALGQSVHEVLESLSILPKEKRFAMPLQDRFEKAWDKVRGRKGGFTNDDSEYKYKQRGMEMIRRVVNNPGPINRPAVKIQKDLPYFWLSDEENIILCGKIDWLEYLPETDSVHIIDFKTGKSEENEDSLQLPIYRLLVHECQHRQTTKASYWYLNSDDNLSEKALPDIEESRKRILEVAKRVKLARQLQHFKCPKNGCYACTPMEEIYNRKAELVGTDEYNYDVYILDKEKAEAEKASVVL